MHHDFTSTTNSTAVLHTSSFLHVSYQRDVAFAQPRKYASTVVRDGDMPTRCINEEENNTRYQKWLSLLIGYKSQPLDE
jgi:hypothetical protein